MKKNYIAPLVIVHELEEFCAVGLTGSKKEDVITPGNDTHIPETEGPGFGGDTGEEPA